MLKCLHCKPHVYCKWRKIPSNLSPKAKLVIRALKVTGFIQASLCKIQVLFKYFLKTFLLFSRSENLYKNTDLHIKILLRKCWTALLKILVLENTYKIVVPLFGAAYAAPNKDTTILYWFRSPKTVLNNPVNGKIQGLFKAFECFSSTFQGKFNFQGLFKTVLYIQVLFPGLINTFIFRWAKKNGRTLQAQICLSVNFMTKNYKSRIRQRKQVLDFQYR